MSERSFYEERAKREAKAAVEGIEAQTSAEIVVCLRGSSGMGPDWKEAVAALERSLLPSPDLDRFLAAMRALGPILARRLPRSADDSNELPDEAQ